MGRREGPIDAEEGPVAEFARGLRALRRKADGITYRAMAARCGYSVTTLAQAAAGVRLPSLPVALAYVRACGGDADEWESRWRAASSDVMEETARAVRIADDEAAPYRGLARFEPGDRHLFFGRDPLIAQLAERVRRHRLVALVGASGSGKSSLLRAGLIPELREDGVRVEGSSGATASRLTRGGTSAVAVDGVRTSGGAKAGGGRAPGSCARERLAAIRIFTPGPHPASTRARLLSPARDEREPVGGRPAEDADTLVIVDQFEELFTLGSEPAERTAFLDLLLAAREPAARMRVVIAVRADFFGRCAEHPGLADALRDATLLVPPMGPAALREAVVRPAASAGLIVERSLTARIIREAGQEPGGLPLMSHALLETWRRRRGRALTEEMYDAVGGVHGAIASTAEEVHRQLTPAQAAAARRVLLRLVSPGHGSPDTRRPVRRGELEQIGRSSRGSDGSRGGRHTAAALEALVHARLVTVDDEHVALAHEALITSWPRLRSWVDQERARLRVHRQLTEAAATWEHLDREGAALYRGSRLAAAQEHFPEHTRAEELTAAEHDFLTASATAHRQEEQTAVRTTRRLRALTATLSILLVLATATTLIAWDQSHTSGQARRKAVAAQRLALSRRLAARSDALIGTDPDLASLLAVQSYRTSPTEEATGSLETAAALPLERRLSGRIPGVDSMAFSPDGRSLVAGSSSGPVDLWNVATGAVQSVVSRSSDEVTSVAYGADSRTVLVGRRNGRVETYNTATAAEHTVRLGIQTICAQVFSTDGRSLSTRDNDGDVQAWDARSGRLHAGHLAAPTGVSPCALALSGDGSTAAADTGRSIRVWDMKSDRATSFLMDQDAFSLSLDRAGRTLAVQGVDIHVWNVLTRHEWPVIVAPSADGSTGLKLSPDGRTLAVAYGRTVRMWDVPSGRQIAVLIGHAFQVDTLAFSPDGRTLATGDDEGNLRLWNVVTEKNRFANDHGVAATSLDGDVASSAEHGQVRLHYLNARRTATLGSGTSALSAVTVAPGGRTVAVAAHHNVLLKDVATGRTTAVLTTGQVRLLVFSPDGRTLVTASDGPLHLWNLSTHRVRGTIRAARGPFRSVAFSPDGHTLAAVADAEGTVGLWNTGTARPLGALRAPRGGESVMPGVGLGYSPDGTTLAVGTLDGQVLLWDIANRQSRVLATDLSREVTAVAFGPDGHTLAIGAADGTVQLWDLSTSRVRATFARHTTAITSITFSPNGRVLTTSSQDSVRVWDSALPNAAQAITRICTAVHRDLTAQERALYLPAPSTTPTCPLPDA